MQEDGGTCVQGTVGQGACSGGSRLPTSSVRRQQLVVSPEHRPVQPQSRVKGPPATRCIFKNTEITEETEITEFENRARRMYRWFFDLKKGVRSKE